MCVCVQTLSAAPPSLEIDELRLFDEKSFDLIGSIAKMLNALIEKVKCTLDVIGDLIGDGELRNVYKKFRADVEAILQNDVQQCKQTKGLLAKIKWV